MENDYKKLWSAETNPATGGRFEHCYNAMLGGSNGTADIDSLLTGEFGKILTERFQERLDYEDDVWSEKCLKHFESLNLKKEIHDVSEDFYSSWLSFAPLDMFTEEGSKKKYPLIIANCSDNGGTYDLGLQNLAGRDRFMFVIPKNTNWDNVSLLADKICGLYPIDRERIYLTGFSYGGYQATACMFRVPWKFAAVAPCANDIYREWDNWRIPYTEGEVETLRHIQVPVIQYIGQCEASNFAPVNAWKPRTHESFPKRGIPDPRDPREDRKKDPTICPQRKLPDGRVIPTPISMMPHPAEGEDPGRWKLNMLNKRMYSLNCQPRDIEKCLSFANQPEDEIHHTLGFYGDDDRIEYVYGHKHWVSDTHDKDGKLMFRYVIWENGVHGMPITMGEYIWNFFRQYRRDTATGKIVIDPYIF